MLPKRISSKKVETNIKIDLSQLTIDLEIYF